MTSLRSKLVTTAAVAAAAVGGATIASAATSSNSATTPSTSQGYGQGQGQGGGPKDQSKGGHQANGKTETLLTGDTAAKVKAAALAKLPGATVDRVETDADSSNPYEAHVTKADGTQVQVSVDASFNVVSVNAMGGH